MEKITTMLPRSFKQSAKGFAVLGIQHASADYAELKLADAAFHAEKKPIIRSAGVVNPIQIDHSRLDQAAELCEIAISI